MSDGERGRQWNTTEKERRETAGLVEKIAVDETEPIMTRLMAAKAHAAIARDESEED